LNILEEAQKAIALIQEGRQALDAITSSVKDGKVAIDATTQRELSTLLEQERGQSQVAHDNLQNAINAARAGAK
jgi:vacuolar-type H+-ATPase subunit B/Vma2